MEPPSFNRTSDRTVSAPPDHGEPNLHPTQEKSALNSQALEFTPNTSAAPQPASYLWTTEVSPFIPQFHKMSAKAPTFSPPSFSPKGPNPDAEEFKPTQPEEEKFIDDKELVCLYNRELTDEETKNSSASDVQFPPEYLYTIQRIKEIHEEINVSERFKELPEGIRKFTTRDIKRERPENKKKNDRRGGGDPDWKQPRKEISRQEQEKWRNGIIRAEEKLMMKAREYKARLSKPIEEREKIKRKIKITLNKLTPTNVEKLKTQLLALAQESLDSLDLLAEGIFDKAWAEIKYTSMYASLCSYCSKAFQAFKFSEDTSIKNEFKNALLLYVEQCFKNKEQADYTGLAPDVMEEKLIIRKKKIEGNVRFIGELFNVGLITAKIILFCVDNLLNSEHGNYETVNLTEHEFIEEDVYGVCILLETGAFKLDHPKIVDWTDKIYGFLARMMETRPLSSRVRFRIMNLIEDRKSGWTKTKNEELRKSRVS